MDKLSIKFPNWKTTVSGIAAVGSTATAIGGLTGQFPFVAPYAPYLLFLGAVCGIVNSALQKTYNVTGGTVSNSPQDEQK